MTPLYNINKSYLNLEFLGCVFSSCQSNTTNSKFKCCQPKTNELGYWLQGHKKGEEADIIYTSQVTGQDCSFHDSTWKENTYLSVPN